MQSPNNPHREPIAPSGCPVSTKGPSLGQSLSFRWRPQFSANCKNRVFRISWWRGEGTTKKVRRLKCRNLA